MVRAHESAVVPRGVRRRRRRPRSHGAHRRRRRRTRRRAQGRDHGPAPARQPRRQDLRQQRERVFFLCRNQNFTAPSGHRPPRQRRDAAPAQVVGLPGPRAQGRRLQLRRRRLYLHPRLERRGHHDLRARERRRGHLRDAVVRVQVAHTDRPRGRRARLHQVPRHLRAPRCSWRHDAHVRRRRHGLDEGVRHRVHGRRLQGARARQHARGLHGPRAGVARGRGLDPADAEWRQPDVHRRRHDV